MDFSFNSPTHAYHYQTNPKTFSLYLKLLNDLSAISPSHKGLTLNNFSRNLSLSVFTQITKFLSFISTAQFSLRDIIPLFSDSTCFFLFNSLSSLSSWFRPNYKLSYGHVIIVLRKDEIENFPDINLQRETANDK